MSKANYLEDKLIDHVLGNSPFTQPSSLYVALHTEDPTEVGATGEVTGGSYARQAAGFDASSGGATANDDDLVFTGMPAVTVSHFTIKDALTDGNTLYVGAFGTPKNTNAGDTLTIPTGDLDVTED